MARTRVVARYDSQWGRDVYLVDRFADFDSVVDGKKYVNTTPGLFWRRVQTFIELDYAQDYAIGLSKAPDDATTERVENIYEDGKEIDICTI